MARRGGLARALFRRRDRAPRAAAPDRTPDLLPTVLDAIADPLLVLDDMHVAHANAAARALFGAFVVEEDARLALRHPLALALLTGREEGPVELVGLGGAERRWVLAATALGEGRRLLHLTDQSAQRAAERMRVDFVANASHELRTPLATLIGFIETLEEANGPADAATRLRFLGIMAGEARRMQRLIDDLMSLSRIEADRYVSPRERVDLSGIVGSAAADLRAGLAGDRIRQAIEPGLIVFGDPAQLSQLAHNIIGNALKYGGPDASVDVTLAAVEGEIRLAIRDRGDGIAPEHIPRLTERFYRVDAGRSRAIGGTGLGLAIVKHIVERHRGRLEIASIVGEGTLVTVWLPEAAPAMS